MTTCQRCQGLLIREDCYDLEGDGQLVALMKCLNCGTRIDPVMAANRLNPPDLTTAKHKRHHFPVSVT